jgi:hypothetical protein
MLGKLEKMIMKKKKDKGEINDLEKKAIMKNLKDLSDSASEMMGDKLGSLSKVTVASDTPEGLKKGLEMAEEKVEEIGREPAVEGDVEDVEEVDVGREPAIVEEEDDGLGEQEESLDDKVVGDRSEEQPSKYDSMSEEEVEKKIKELMDIKEKLKMKG